MTFEKHLRSVSRAATQRLGIMSKSPVLEYCSAVWCSATNLHRKLLDRVLKTAVFLAGGVVECTLAH